jgi:DNA-binding NtrC family response regulator
MGRTTGQVLHEHSLACETSFAELNLLGESPAFRDVLQTIERFATVDATVLIQGETGTGKELAARALHHLSRRRDFPFIPINCGALPDSLLESELFGHERGAFTDAKQATRGLIAQAEGGTLFFDEIEVMSARAQAVLLRFLQDHKYRPVGGRMNLSSDLRVIASSNVDLDHLVDTGEFRRDLLFRFKILSINLPPLRQRGRDVVLLAEHFLKRFAAEHHQTPKRLHADAIARLQTHHWPGNIRELENLILREFVLAEGDVIELRSIRNELPERGADRKPASTFKTAKAEALAEFEKGYLDHLLTRTHGNISLAARISQKDRSALNKLVRKHGLNGERFRSAAS